MDRQPYSRGPPPLEGNGLNGGPGPGPSGSMSASLSPNGAQRGMSQQSLDRVSLASMMRARSLRNTRCTEADLQASPPRPTPSSRMSLSALVNSPVNNTQTLPPLPSPSRDYPPIQSNGHTQRQGLSRTHSHHSQHSQRYSPDPYPYRNEYQPSTTTYRARSPSPVYPYRSGSGSVITSGREGRHSRSPVKMGYAMRMGDKLVGNEDVWENGLQQYQRRREQEVDDLAALSLEDIVRSPSSPC